MIWSQFKILFSGWHTHRLSIWCFYLKITSYLTFTITNQFTSINWTTEIRLPKCFMVIQGLIFTILEKSIVDNPDFYRCIKGTELWSSRSALNCVLCVYISSTRNNCKQSWATNEISVQLYVNICILLWDTFSVGTMASEHNIHRPETHIQQYKNIVRREAFVSRLWCWCGR